MASRPAAAALAAAALALTGCGGAGGGPREAGGAGEEHESETVLAGAADQTVCLADAKPADLPASFPSAWPFPPRTTAYHVEDRAGVGMIVTAVSAEPIHDLVEFLNHDAVAAGFTVTGGETEEHDAEANWTASGYTGRWTVRESGSCPGESILQVLAAPSR